MNQRDDHLPCAEATAAAGAGGDAAGPTVSSVPGDDADRRRTQRAPTDRAPPPRPPRRRPGSCPSPRRRRRRISAKQRWRPSRRRGPAARARARPIDSTNDRSRRGGDGRDVSRSESFSETDEAPQTAGASAACSSDGQRDS